MRSITNHDRIDPAITPLTPAIAASRGFHQSVT
jgi:hypothetical protein